MLTAAAARAGEARLAEDFGRFADRARARPEAAAVPLGERFASPQAPRAATLSAAAPLRRFPSLSPVPAPVRRLSIPKTAPAPSGATPKGRRHPTVDPTGLALVAAGGLLLLALRPDGKGTKAAASAAETWAPPPTWKREWPRGAAHVPQPLPPLRTARAEPTPSFPEPWWGVTDAEQEALARWDASLDKRHRATPLDRWLDANRSDLKGVDVERLKAKLRRDA